MMKIILSAKEKALIIFLVILQVVLTVSCLSYEGDNGYDGGSAIEDEFKAGEYKYREVCFITGEPVVFEGTLTIKKTVKSDYISATYNYNLANIERDATLVRVLVYNTKLEEKDFGQAIENTYFTKKPTEVIKINGNIYQLTDYTFTRSKVKDKQPAIDFYAGETYGKKIYKVGTGGDGGRITVELTGKNYGYDQAWGNAWVNTTNILIQTENGTDSTADAWGGTAVVNVSSNKTREHKYIKNDPFQISFEGGYIETEKDYSILEYTAKLPLFDSKGISTDKMTEYHKVMEMEASPSQKRLVVPDLTHLRGHWAENEIKILHSLEIFEGSGSSFDPNRYMTRAELATAFVKAAKTVPVDPSLAPKRATTASRRTTVVETSPYIDVEVEDKYYKSIKEALDRKIMFGTGSGYFEPNKRITMAEVVAVMIRALGLESLAPNPTAVTTFKDNDEIPSYFRSYVSAAQRIGLIHGDEKGYFKPNSSITYERAAMLIYNFIEYMGKDIREDYRERVLDY